jgi:hypothetical protein
VSLTAEAVTQILESRYDWYSARAVLRMAATTAGLDPSGPFDARQVDALANALLKVGQRVESTAAGLREAAAKTDPAKKPAPPAGDEAGASPAAPAAEADAAPASADDDDKKAARQKQQPSGKK